MPLRQVVDPKHGSAIDAGVPLDFGASRSVVQVDPEADVRRTVSPPLQTLVYLFDLLHT